MEENTGLSEVIKSLQEKNQKTIQKEEANRTAAFQSSMQTISESLNAQIADTSSILSPMAQEVAGNLRTLIGPLADGQELSNNESKAIASTLKELIGSIQSSDKIVGEDQKALLNILNQTNNAINKNVFATSNLNQKFSEYADKASETAINATSGLAALVSGNNPLVMLLTKTLLSGTKNGLLAVKRWNDERKARKLERELTKKQTLETLQVKESVEKNTETNENNSSKQNDSTNDVLETSSSVLEHLAVIRENTSMMASPTDVTLAPSSSTMASPTDGMSGVEGLLERQIQNQESDKQVRLVKDAESLESEREKVQLQKDMIEAIEGVGGGAGVAPEEEKLNFGFIASLIFIGTQFIMGFVTELVSQFKTLGTLVRKVWTGLINKVKNTKLGKFLTEFFGKIGAKFTELVTKFKNSKVGKFIDEFITKFKSIGKNILTKVDDVKKAIFNSPITKFFIKMKDLFGKMTGFFKPMLASADDVGGIVRRLGTFARGFGTFLGKLAFPITIAMAIFDTVTGFIDGYKEGGIIEGIKGGIVGLFDSIIGAPLDLLRQAVAWILGKFGFKDAEASLNSFSYKELFAGIVDKVFGAFTGVFDSFADGDIMGGIGKLISGYIKTIYIIPLDLIKDAFSGILKLFGKDDAAASLDSFSFSDMFDKVFGKIWEKITGVFDLFADVFDSFADGDIMGGIGKLIIGYIRTITTLPLDLIKDAFSGILKLFGKDDAAASLDSFSFSGMFDKVFGKIWEKITGVFDWFADIFSTFASGDILGGFQKWITGALNTLVYKPIDLLKDGISWIMSKLGFEQFSELLDSFSFSEMFTNLSNKIFDFFGKLKDKIIGWIPGLGNDGGDDEDVKLQKRATALGDPVAIQSMVNSEKKKGMFGGIKKSKGNAKLDMFSEIYGDYEKNFAKAKELSMDPNMTSDKFDNVLKTVRSSTVIDEMKNLVNSGFMSEETGMMIIDRVKVNMNELHATKMTLGKSEMLNASINESKTGTLTETMNTGEKYKNSQTQKEANQLNASEKGAKAAAAFVTSSMNNIINNNSSTSVNMGLGTRMANLAGE